jgi:hypothetical protein
MVNAINLTMTSKQDIATWKANRRKLAYSTVGTPDYVSDAWLDNNMMPEPYSSHRSPWLWTRRQGRVRLTQADLTRNLPPAGLRQGMRLVVSRRDHV